MKPVKLVIPWYTAVAMAIVFIVAGMGIAKFFHERNWVPYSCAVPGDSDADGVDTSGNPPAPVLPPDQGIEINKIEFDSLSDKFMARFPNEEGWLGNHGGKIGKEAMQLILSSLTPGENYIEFMFGFDSSLVERKTYLLLRGGSSGNRVTGEERIMIRNGGTPDTWCPMVCPVR